MISIVLIIYYAKELDGCYGAALFRYNLLHTNISKLLTSISKYFADADDYHEDHITTKSMKLYHAIRPRSNFQETCLD